jgi:drug/metabolite transporter (DMT)-like permease
MPASIADTEIRAVGLPARRAHRLGVLMMVASAVAFSSAGFFTRLITLDAPALLFWRGIFSALTLAAFAAWQQRGSPLRGLGGRGLLLAGLGSLAMISFVWSLRLSSVAEVSVIYATVPVATAGLGWLLLGEPAGRLMLLACLATLVGMVVMMSGGQAQAHWAGDLVAVGMTLISAVFMVALRWRRDTATTPALAAAALCTAVVVAPWAHPLSASPVEIGWCALFGCFQNGVGLILMALGARYVTAGETALYGALDAPLAPLWVWVAFAEIPSLPTLAGGTIVMTAVLAFLAASGPSGAPPGASRASRWR